MGFKDTVGNNVYNSLLVQTKYKHVGNKLKKTTSIEIRTYIKTQFDQNS